jgi:exosortase
VLVALTLALFWAGHRVDNQYIGFFSLQILIVSLVIWLLGWQWVVALAFPLAFLTFTWPLQFLDNYVTFPLRMFMANTSVAILNTCGLPAIQNGSGILSAATINLAAGERFSVDVADPCSGIRSLFALMMVSAIYGNFAVDSPWKRPILFLLSVPLAILGNIFRILLLIIGIIILGSPVAIGTLEHPSWYHEGAGYAVFLVALTGMLLACKLLNTSRSTWRHQWRTFTEAAKPTPPPHEGKLPDDIY